MQDEEWIYMDGLDEMCAQLEAAVPIAHWASIMQAWWKLISIYTMVFYQETHISSL